MPDSLPPFPIDEVVLEAVLHGLAGAYEIHNGAHVLVPFKGEGGDFTFDDVLDFYSGYDPTKLTPYTDDSGHTHDDIVEYPDAQYHYSDVIRALIAEVQRLRPVTP